MPSPQPYRARKPAFSPRPMADPTRVPRPLQSPPPRPAPPPWVGAGGPPIHTTPQPQADPTRVPRPAASPYNGAFTVRSPQYLAQQADTYTQHQMQGLLGGIPTEAAVRAPYDRQAYDVTQLTDALRGYISGAQTASVDANNRIITSAQGGADAAQAQAAAAAAAAGAGPVPQAAPNGASAALAGYGTSTANLLGAEQAAAGSAGGIYARAIGQQATDALAARQQQVAAAEAQRPGLYDQFLQTLTEANRATATGNRDFTANRSDALFNRTAANREYTAGRSDTRYNQGAQNRQLGQTDRAYTASREDAATAKTASQQDYAEKVREFDRTQAVSETTAERNWRIAQRELGIKKGGLALDAKKVALDAKKAEADAYLKQVAEQGRNNRAAAAEAGREGRSAAQIAAANKRAAASRKAAAQAFASKQGATKDSNWSKTIDHALGIAQGSAATSTSTSQTNKTGTPGVAGGGKPTGYDVTVKNADRSSAGYGSTSTIHFGPNWDQAKHPVPEGMSWVATRPVKAKGSAGSAPSTSKTTTTSSSGQKGSRSAAIAYIEQQARIQGRKLGKGEAAQMVDAWLGNGGKP